MNPVTTRLRAGEALPAVLVLRDLAELLGLGPTRVWELYKAGEFARFELLPRLGNRPRFSGKKFQAWIEGEEDQADGLRYFASARRQRSRP
jgi:predicted DNA-binding transcriptional regulator AlpA